MKHTIPTPIRMVIAVAILAFDLPLGRAHAAATRVLAGRMACCRLLPVLWMVGILTAGGVQAAPNPADFVARIDNPYYPLMPGTTYHYDSTIDRIDEVTVTHETKVIQGVTCAVVQDRAIVNGVLKEESFDWFAQDRVGNVWRFGGDSREFDDNGVLISTEGSWEAGLNGAEPGMAMPAHPQVNQTYRQEWAPGVAEDMATVLTLDAGTQVAFGTFTNCILTRNFSSLYSGEVEHKYYAVGIGLVRSVMVEGGTEWVELGTITRDPVDPASFVARIDNPYYPLTPGHTNIYAGTEGGRSLTAVVDVMAGAKVIQGVTCTVVRDRSLVDGVLAEEAFDWFAQDKEGNVWCFGEDARHYDTNGVVISTDGSWEAGQFGAQPGIVMPAHPWVNQSYFQELAPGVAQDMATVLALDAGATLALGAFTNCVLTRDYNPLEPGLVEHKYYAPGVGFILSAAVEGGTEQLGLVSVQPLPQPRLGIATRRDLGGVTLTLYGIPGQTYALESSTDLVSWASFVTNTPSGNRFGHFLTNTASNPREFFRGGLR